MSETDRRNQKKPAVSAKKPSSASVKTATVASKAPSKKKDAHGKGKDPTQMEAKIKKKSDFGLLFVPVILAILTIFLGACLILDAIGQAATPDDHLMGWVGYYTCYLLFGCFGWAAYLIPFLLINMMVFWRRRYTEGRIPVKTFLSVFTLILLAAVIHVFDCALDTTGELAQTLSFVTLFKTGATFASGGILGGYPGYLLYMGLRLPGTILVAVLVLPPLLMYLVGVSPVAVAIKIGKAMKKSIQDSAEERAVRRAERAEAKANEEYTEEAEDEIPDGEDDEYKENESYGDESARSSDRKTDRRSDNRRVEGEDSRQGRNKKKSSARDTYADATEESSGTYDDGMGAAEDNLVVNSRTGEVLGTERSRGSKSVLRRNDKRDPAPFDEDGNNYEPEGLPFYDTPAEVIPEPAPERPRTEARSETREKRSAPVYTASRTQAETLRTEAVEPEDFADDEDMSAETMEVGYDDDFEDTPAPKVKYEVITDNGETPLRTQTGKNDPYATVRILKSETAAVAEAGLSEEEVVISSARDASEDGEGDEDMPPREYVFPPIDLLTKGSNRYEANEEEIAENTQILREVLESFRIGVREISCSCGPTITRFEVKPDSGVRVRSIANLVDDIAMGMAKAGVRIEAPIPGKAAVGIEVPNAEPSTVYFRNILETPEFRNHKSRIAACLGADVSGRPVILDINKMPHLLVAGTTGSGKSVCINSIIMSILYKAKPDEVKLILIDPKKVEFAVYRDLPHLYCPIISDPKKAAGALNSAVNEMERRFELIEEVGVRNIAGYNEVTADDPARPYMPQMVIIIDELADLMMTASNEVETAICRLAQKARAAGMHLILGTQRPSTDVITGLIKANVPSRIAFTVTQSVDSRIIIDTVGAEKLIGRGDMLYSPVGTTKPLRVQGTFVSDGEVERVVTFLKENNERGEFDESFTRQIEIEAAKCAAGKKKGGAEQMDIDDFSGLGGGGGGGRKDNEDPKFWEALEVAAGKDKIGTSALQRALNLGYGRAAKIIDRMEELGFVGPDPGTKQGRKVLITKQEYLEYRANGLPGNGGSEGGDEGDFDDL